MIALNFPLFNTKQTRTCFTKDLEIIAKNIEKCASNEFEHLQFAYLVFDSVGKAR